MRQSLDDALRAALAGEAIEPSPALVARTLAAARGELLAGGGRYRRELARLFVPAVAALPLVLLANAAAAWLAWLALSRGLPAPAPPELVRALLGAWAFGAVGWLALFFASLPALAHRSLARRLSEVSP